MSLSDLIKGTARPGAFATATPATVATDDQWKTPTVATVATVNVATSTSDCYSTDSFSSDEERLVRRWLSSIGETEQSLIERTIYYCRNDGRSREFFLAQSLALTAQTND